MNLVLLIRRSLLMKAVRKRCFFSSSLQPESSQEFFWCKGKDCLLSKDLLLVMTILTIVEISYAFSCAFQLLLCLLAETKE